MEKLTLSTLRMDDMKIRELNLPAKPKQTICKAKTAPMDASRRETPWAWTGTSATRGIEGDTASQTIASRNK